MKVKTLKKKVGFGSNLGHIRVKQKQKVFKLVRGCQAVTGKVQMQLWQNFAVTKGIFLQT